MQSLFVGDNKWIKVDRMFVDGGTPAKMGIVGGHSVEIAAAVAAKPTILMAHGGFYYLSRQPVTELEDVSYLPKPYRGQAEEWIKRQSAKAKPLALTRGLEAEDGRPIPPDRGPSLRGQERVIDSPEQADRELIGGGLRELDREESRRRTL